MKIERTEHFLNFCCEMGRHLVQSGAEIYRVEDSITRLKAQIELAKMALEAMQRKEAEE